MNRHTSRLRLLLVALLVGFSVCAAAAERHQRLIILHTNDIHGSLQPQEAWWINPDFPPPVGNAPAAANIIEGERSEAAAEGTAVLLIDTGDFFQGTPVGEYENARAMIDWFNRMEYDYLTLGNHDYDRGQEFLRNTLREVKAEVLCANIIETATGMAPAYLKPYDVREIDGLKVGIFGLTTQYLRGMSTPDHVAGLEFSQEIDAATQAVQKLRASGADLVIGITHVGYKHDREIALAVPGIDVIIGGHSHTGLTVPYEDPLHHTIICQTYGHLTTVGRLELDLDMETRSIAAYQGELQELFTEAVPMDRKVNDEVQALVRKSEKGFDVVIGQSRSQLTRAGMEESSLGNLITDAMREEHHGDVAFHNSGGMRADLPKGDVLYRDVYEIDAYGNSVVTLDLTGAQVWKACEVSINGHHAIFQVSGIRMTYDKSKPIGQRILEITVNGEPLDSARVYHVVTNSFLGAGGGEYEVFGQGENFEDSGVMLRDVLANYIRRHSPVEAKVEGRIVELSGR